MILEHKKRDRLTAVSPKSGTIPKPLSPIQKPRWRISVGAINHAFLSAGGNANEYGAAMHRAVADGWLEAHPSGAYVQLTQKGADSVAGDARYPSAMFGFVSDVMLRNAHTVELVFVS